MFYVVTILLKTFLVSKKMIQYSRDPDMMTCGPGSPSSDQHQASSGTQQGTPAEACKMSLLVTNDPLQGLISLGLATISFLFSCHKDRVEKRKVKVKKISHSDWCVLTQILRNKSEKLFISFHRNKVL